MNSDDFLARNRSSKKDTRLRPYLVRRPRRLLPKAQQRIVGSALVAGAAWIFGFTLYAVGVSLFIDFYLEEQMLDDRLFNLKTQLGVWGFFAISFFLGSQAFNASGKYGTAISAFFDTADAIGTATIYVAGRMQKQGLSKRVTVAAYQKNDSPDPKQDEPYLLEQPLIDVVQDLQSLLRSLAFTIKHNFRTNPAVDNFSASVASDVDLAQPGVIVRLLPMECRLLWELEHLETDAIGGTLYMILDKYNILAKEGLVIATNANGVNAHINSVGTQASVLNSLSVRGTIAPYSDILLVGLIVWGLFFPWELWGSFRYWSILISFVAYMFVFGIYGLSVKIDNPFNRAGSSPYIYHDIGALTRGIAENVDDVFDKFVADSALFHQQASAKKGTARVTITDDTADADDTSILLTGASLRPSGSHMSRGRDSSLLTKRQHRYTVSRHDMDV